jgi:hypothetical protein
VVVYVLRFRRVKLNYALVLVPEQVLDEAHFLPVGRTAWGGDTDVFPTIVVVVPGRYDVKMLAGRAEHSKRPRHVAYIREPKVGVVYNPP